MTNSSLALSPGRISFSQYKEVFRKLKNWINTNLPDSSIQFWNGSTNQQYVSLKQQLLNDFPLSASVYQQLPKRVSSTLVFVDANYNVYLGFTNNSDVSIIDALINEEKRIPILIADNVCMFAALAYGTISYNKVSGATLIGNPSMIKASNSSLLSRARNATFYQCYTLDKSSNLCGRTNVIQSFDRVTSKIYTYPNPPQVMAWTALFTSYPYKWQDLGYVNSSGGYFPEACLCFQRQDNDYNLYGIIGQSSSNLWKITTYPTYKELLFLSTLYNGLTNNLNELLQANSNLYFQSNDVSVVAPTGATWNIESSTTTHTVTCNSDGLECSGGGTQTSSQSNTLTVQSAIAENHQLVLVIKSDPKSSSSGEIMSCTCCEGLPSEDKVEEIRTEQVFVSSAGVVIAYVNDLNTTRFPTTTMTGTSFVFQTTQKKQVRSITHMECDGFTGNTSTTTEMSYIYDSRNYRLFKLSLFMLTIPVLNRSTVCFNRVFNKALIAIDALVSEFIRFDTSLNSINTPPPSYVVVHPPTIQMSTANSNTIPLGASIKVSPNSINFEKPELDTPTSCTVSQDLPDGQEMCECKPPDIDADKGTCVPKGLSYKPQSISFSFECN